jgi:hypothetical protein
MMVALRLLVAVLPLAPDFENGCSTPSKADITPKIGHLAGTQSALAKACTLKPKRRN